LKGEIQITNRIKTLLESFKLQSAKEKDSSIAKYEEILKAAPSDKDVWMSLGCLYHRKFQFEKAIENKLKASSISPNDAELKFSLGCSYCAKVDFSAAIKSYSEALALKPDYVKACEGLAEQYQIIGQQARAEEWLSKAEELKCATTKNMSWT
jgi:protein O-GlcNAc transferase